MMDKCIGDYAMIGDGETAALISRTAALEWLCLPRFDSEACCAAILGDKENGCWHMTLKGGVTETKRRYREKTLILETVLTCDTGKVRLTDFMPIRGSMPDVVRIAECIEGEAELTSELFLRFDYGRISPLVRTCEGKHLLAISGPDGVSLDFDDEIHFDDRRFTTQSAMRKGDRRSFVLTWYPSHEDPPERVDPDEALTRTQRYWREWIRCMDYDGPYAEAVARSLITLKAMIHHSTGGIVAAPTASLPEWIGGERNWDYRFCWLRDATFSLLSLIRMGLQDEAHAWIDWLRRAVGGEPIDLKPFYTVTGQPRAIEWKAPWLPGFGESTPVRFGNQAIEQLQLDIYGEVIDCLYQARREGLCNDGDSSHLVRLIADSLRDVWDRPDAGIWESRGAPRHHVYSKVMCWVAFDRAAHWFEDEEPDLSAQYAELAQTVRNCVLERGWSDKLGRFTRAFDDPHLDAALLRLPMVDFLPADEPRMAATIDAIERELSVSDGVILRYRPEQTDDGFDCPEGAFTAACFWLAEARAMQGDEERAQHIFENVLSRANDVGLLAEQLDWESGRQLGNFPQALSHLALIRVAHTLKTGKRRGE